MLAFDVKKVSLIAIILIFGLLCGFGIYWFFFRSNQTAPVPGSTIDLSGQLPSIGGGTGPDVIGEGGVLPELGDIIAEDDTEGILSPRVENLDSIAQGSNTSVNSLDDNRISDINLNASGNGFVLYDREESMFYGLSADGETKYLLSSKKFYSVDNVAWAPSKDKAIIEYPDGSNVYYDFIQDKGITLPKEMQEPVFDQSSKKIAFKFVTEDDDNNWLVISDPTGEDMSAIEPIGDRGYLVQVNWSPNSKIVAFYHKSVGIDQEEIFFIGQYGENFKSMRVDCMGFKGIWSQAGNRILYHVVSGQNDYKPSLWIVSAGGDEIGLNKFNLGLNTWVDKCTFDATGKQAYCAVPKELEIGAGLYPDLVVSSGDIFYRIDLAAGIKHVLANPILDQRQVDFNVGQIFLSPDEKYLFFWDEKTEQVYRMQLK